MVLIDLSDRSNNPVLIPTKVDAVVSLFEGVFLVLSADVTRVFVGRLSLASRNH